MSKYNFTPLGGGQMGLKALTEICGRISLVFGGRGGKDQEVGDRPPCTRFPRLYHLSLSSSRHCFVIEFLVWSGCSLSF